MAFIFQRAIDFLKKWRLAAAYAIVIILTMPQLLSWQYKLIFILFSFAIFFILWQSNEKKSSETEINQPKENKFFIWMLVASVVFLIITRMWPFLKFGAAPLGYDTGFYVSAMRSFHDGTYAPYYFSMLPFSLSGVSALFSLYSVYLLTQMLIAGGLYFFFRSLKSKNSFAMATIAVFLFAASVTQFQAYWWMFGQQLLSIAFLIFTFGLIFRGSYLAIFAASVGIMVHPPTFIVAAFASLIFLIIYLIQLLARKRALNKNTLLLLICAGSVAALVVALRFDYFITIFNTYIVQHKGLATTFGIYQQKKMLGLFINASTFHFNCYLILPFSIIGFLMLTKWKIFLNQKNDLLILLYSSSAVIAIMSAFPFIYQQRSLIIFDIFLIIFAAPIVFTIINFFISNDKIGKIIITLFFIIFCARVALVAWHQMPQLWPEELKEITELNKKIEPNSILLSANSLYDPWLRGFAPSFMVISPGMENDIWSLNDWSEFWSGYDETRRYDLLNKVLDNKKCYNLTNLYIFIGNRENANLPYQQFIRNNQRFTNISAHFWKYNLLPI